MRVTMFLAVAAAALGLGFSQPAKAGGWNDGCCGGNVYIHHHVYFPPRYVHVYQYHRPAARHINVVHYGYGYDCCGYFAPVRPYGWHVRRYW